jgi:hypothetical protein
MFFFLTCTFLLQLCKVQTWSLARNQHRVSGDQQDSLDSAGQLGPELLAIWMYSFADMDLQLFSLNF